MKNIKRTYIIFSILLIVLVSGLCISFAFLTNKLEQHGKLNIVAGKLNYKLESSDLENNEITVDANTTKEITLSLTSLNSVSSKYELYYTLDSANDDVSVGYSKDTKDSVLGTIDANSSKTVTIVIRNESDTDTIVKFDVIGGLVNNDLTLINGNSLNQVVGKYIAYNIGDAVTAIDGSKWHVLEASDENSETVVLLSDYNLNNDGTYNTTCGMNINSTTSCSGMAFDADNTNTYSEADTNNIGYFIKNTYAPVVTAALPDITNITLPTAAQIANADSKTFTQSELSLTSSWILLTSYWTKTANNTSSNLVWFVRGTAADISNRFEANDSNYIGVRPVITTPKSNLIAE